MAATSRRAGKSPYALEDFSILLRRSRLGAAWRWRTEMSVMSGGVTGFFECWHCIGLDAAGAAFGGGLAVAAALPWSRRFLLARFWCLVSRHRLQRTFWETRLHTRAGHLPLILWTCGTKVGERAYVLSRAGLSLADFEDAGAAFAAACSAREARVTASPRWSQLIRIDILRRDLLGPRNVVRSSLLDVTGPVAVPVPAAEDTEGEPPAARPGWPQIEPGGPLS